MDIRKIKKLIELLEDSGIAELEIEEETKEGVRESIRLNRYPSHSAPVAAPTIAVSGTVPVAAAPAPASPASASQALPVPEADDVEPAGHAIKSPMVGSFYRAPTPGGKPFVDVGTVVKEGDTLCIIEAMKMLNQIESDKSGKVIAILVENGQPVEYDQTLFVIE
jgi:acetyl-CoA carboxylase biotin carboxyl carrier protein